MTQKKKEKKKILVMGLGAIGGIFAAHMKKAGNIVYGIDVRQDYVDAIRQEGIMLEGLISLKAELDQVCTHPDQLRDKDIDYAVVAVKTSHLEDAVAMIKGFNDHFSVVAMQNGIDNEEFLAGHFGRERAMRIVVNFAGNVLVPGLIKMTFFHKPNYVGCLCDQPKECSHEKMLAKLMTDALLDTEAVKDIKKYAWRKTILVAALSPVSALLGMTMAEVMNDGETRSIVVKLLMEAIKVAKLMGYDYGEGFFGHCLDYLSTAGHHKPSMLVDIERGDPTEIDFVNGRIAYHGNLLNADVLLNVSLTSMIKAKERLLLAQKEKKTE